MDQIEQTIANALTCCFPTIALQYNYGNSYIDWTNAVKAIFNAIGHTKNYRSYSHFKTGGKYTCDEIKQHVQQALRLPVPNYQKEWLYDILWWDEQGGYVKDIPLVAESEWGDRGAVDADFQRLLLARSKYRVMIFECTAKAYNGIIQRFQQEINHFGYTQTSDRYLFCGWLNNEFNFESYIVP